MQREGEQAHHPKKVRLRTALQSENECLSPLLHRQPERKQMVVSRPRACAHKVPQNNPKLNMKGIRLWSLVHYPRIQPTSGVLLKQAKQLRNASLNKQCAEVRDATQSEHSLSLSEDIRLLLGAGQAVALLQLKVYSWKKIMGSTL